MRSEPESQHPPPSLKDLDRLKEIVEALKARINQLEQRLDEVVDLKTELRELKAQIEKLSKSTNSTVDHTSELTPVTPAEQVVAPTILGNCKLLQDAIETAKRAAQSDFPILILGESGTGKELFPQLIHCKSKRKGGPFVVFNAAAIPVELIESELFGSEEGGFTGAKKEPKPGRFELANQGTLVIDEVGDMSPQAQAKMLRASEGNGYQRVGGTQTLKPDVRIIATTNQDLEGRVESGEFRKDLFYRLNVVRIDLPPLRERGNDIILLANHFLGKYSQEHDKPLRSLMGNAQTALLHYAWPGNVRELDNLMKRLSIMIDEPVITDKDLSLAPRNSPTQQAETSQVRTLGIIEKEEIQKALTLIKGTNRDIARALDIHPNTLRNLKHKHGLS